MNPNAPVTTPRHVWIVGVLSLLWNSFGCFDYTMTNTRNADYLAQFTPEMMQAIDASPAWTMAAWAFGVWGALAGSLLLLARSRFAVHAFALSLAGLAASTAYRLGQPAVEGMAFGAMNAVIWIVAMALLWYAWTGRKAGVLR